MPRVVRVLPATLRAELDAAVDALHVELLPRDAALAVWQHNVYVVGEPEIRQCSISVFDRLDFKHGIYILLAIITTIIKLTTLHLIKILLESPTSVHFPALSREAPCRSDSIGSHSARSN